MDVWVLKEFLKDVAWIKNDGFNNIQKPSQMRMEKGNKTTRQRILVQFSYRFPHTFWFLALLCCVAALLLYILCVIFSARSHIVAQYCHIGTLKPRIWWIFSFVIRTLAPPILWWHFLSFVTRFSINSKNISNYFLYVYKEGLWSKKLLAVFAWMFDSL